MSLNYANIPYKIKFGIDGEIQVDQTKFYQTTQKAENGFKTFCGERAREVIDKFSDMTRNALIIAANHTYDMFSSCLGRQQKIKLLYDHGSKKN